MKTTLSIFLVLTLTACGTPQTLIGPRGADGATGASGVGGTRGTGCTVKTLVAGSQGALNGGSLITCGDGTSSVVLNGVPGVEGTAGSPGTVITPVQFCKGFTQSYPSTFAESGVCIQGIMFGVYSANGGFLSELPAGTYSSGGINASCTFTIGANCAVN